MSPRLIHIPQSGSGGRGCVVSWGSRFPEPIVLPDGRQAGDLRESIAHLVKTVSAAERRLPAVFTAANGDGVAQIEADHFEQCPVCSRWFDIRDLAQVADPHR